MCHLFEERSHNWQIIFFDRTDFFWRITLSHPFFYGGWHFTRVVAAMHSFRGYMKQIIFDSSCFLRTATFLEDLFRDSRAVYLFHHSNCDHPTLEVVYFFFFFSSILWMVLRVFWQENLQSSVVWVVFSAVATVIIS